MNIKSSVQQSWFIWSYRGGKWEHPALIFSALIFSALISSALISAAPSSVVWSFFQECLSYGGCCCKGLNVPSTYIKFWVTSGDDILCVTSSIISKLTLTYMNFTTWNMLCSCVVTWTTNPSTDWTWPADIYLRVLLGPAGLGSGPHSILKSANDCASLHGLISAAHTWLVTTPTTN